MSHKEWKSIKIGRRQRQLKCLNDAEILFMESPFEIQERHDDRAHSDETSREELMQPKQRQNSGHLLQTALGD